jgi:RNA polymerase sigma-70 factor (ECF subfamily)
MAGPPVKGPPREVTLLLKDWNLGNRDALSRLISLVNRGRTGHALQPAAPVHEPYLRLVEQDHADWQNSAHVMRRLLIDYAHARKAAKGGGPLRIPDGFPAEEIRSVDEAIGRLSALDPRQAQVVEMPYFAGPDIEETAAAIGVSADTARRDWIVAAVGLISREANG